MKEFMDILMAVIIISASGFDIMFINLNRMQNNKSLRLTRASIVTGIILFFAWITKGIVIKNDPIWFNYIMAIAYVFLVWVRIVGLAFIQNEIEEENAKRKYYYDSESGMLRKKNEEVFNDGRPLYCASSLLLRQKDDDQENNNNN